MCVFVVSRTERKKNSRETQGLEGLREEKEKEKERKR
jgi:hypothetical protein